MRRVFHLLSRIGILIFVLGGGITEAQAYRVSWVATSSFSKGRFFSEFALPSASGPGLPGQGWGILSEGGITQTLSFETGVLYLSQSATLGTTSSLLSLPMIHIPAMVRYRLADSLSLGLGAYASYGLGQVSGGAPGSSYIYGTQVRSQDYGVSSGVRFTLKVLEGVHLLFDARYLFGLNELSLMGQTRVLTRDLQGFVGVSFGKD